VPYAYRSFDRQYLILDTRVIDFPRPGLWSTEGPSQVFISEPHTNVIDDGPALTFTCTVPDMHCFQGHHGGRVLPLYRDAAGTTPNIAPGLLHYLQQALAREVVAEDLLAYIAAAVAHPGCTRLFRDDLAIPGIRVPLSTDQSLWNQAIDLGHQVVLLHTFATRYPDPVLHQLTAPQPPEQDGPRILSVIPYTTEEMPDTVQYDQQTQTICIGRTGRVAPVPSTVWDYRVGGMRVVDKWIRYRLKNPRGRPPSTPLDMINATNWTRSFNDDLLGLLHTLTQLVRLEPAQDILLREICSGPVIDTLQLRVAGVLPIPASARGPVRYPSPTAQLII
jgi:predicted helicase